jgi:fluoride ion exporter CrcB/FEX
LDETTTSRFSAKKLTLVEKEKAISHAANILGGLLRCWISMIFASDTAPDRFTRDFLVRKISN